MTQPLKADQMEKNGTMSRLAKQAAEKVAHGASGLSHRAAGMSHDAANHLVKEPASDWFVLLKDYTRQKPDVVMCWCFALGVVVGWKLRP